MLRLLDFILSHVFRVKCRSCGYFTLKIKDGLCIECQAEVDLN